MTHVAIKTLDLHLRALERRGAPIEPFFAGTGITAADVRAAKGRIPWSDFVELTDRLAQLLGSPRALEEAGADLLDAPNLQHVVSIAGLFAHPRHFYWVAHKWAGASLFGVIETSFEVVGPTRVHLHVHIPEPHRPSAAFFHMNAGTFRAAPRVIGLPESIVRHHVDGRRCTYVIDHPPAMTLFSRLRHKVFALFAADRLFGELRAQNDELRLRIEELRRARAEAEELSRLKTQLLDNVTHELRTPMNGVIGLAELLLGSELSPEDQLRVDMIRTSAGGLLRVLDDLLDYARVESSSLALEVRDYDVRALFARLEATFRAEVAAKGLAFSASVAPDLPPALRGDERRIEQVLFNLLDNAVKFTAKGAVMLSARTETAVDGAERVRFEVRDTGPGIPESVQSTLFTPFLQADGALARVHGGTGLGLALADRLARLMGGTLGYDTALGQGSRMWLRVPLQRAVDPTERAPAANPSASTHRTPTLRAASTLGVLEASAPATPPSRGLVLVAEDNAVNRLVIVRQLEKLGFSVDTVENGRGAVEAAERRAYSVILMDVQMPEVDGLQATALIRARSDVRDFVPILAVTAHSEPEMVARVRAAGMNGLVAKPLSAERLAAALERSLSIGPGDWLDELRGLRSS